MAYTATLLVCGVVWFLIAGFAGSSLPVFGEMWIQHLLCALTTSLCVGFLLKKSIACYAGWRWYVLPLLSLFLGTSLFGLLLPSSWLITQWITGNGGVDLEAFYTIPLFMVLFSLTLYLPIFYPAALLTNSALRMTLRLKEKNA
ncbi:MAG TPA: hypothetical protein DCP63_12765 [Bacteroidetes bacterium]|nr:hypothetical protein [Bacteroidota bacterium]